MKTTVKITASLILTVAFLFCIVSCGTKTDVTGLWENATYTKDTTIGSGANTVKVLVSAEETSITITVKTDKETLGEALFENGLINDASFFNVCNGMTADWDKDQAYWAFYVNGEMASFGVGDSKATTVGDNTYKIVYTK